MSSTKSLSSTGRRLLETAADRPSHSLLPMAPDVPVRGAVRQRLLAGLLGAGLVEEVPATDIATAWRTDETGRGIALCVTAQGVAAIGRTPAPTRREARARRPVVPAESKMGVGGTSSQAGGEAAGCASGENAQPVLPAATAERHPGGKLGRVLAALSSNAGAALPDLVALTGWQPHTTRAALTRLRQRGHALERLELNGRVVYRLAVAG